MGGVCGTYGERGGACRVLVWKQVKTPLGRPSRRWEDNSKVDLKEMGWGHVLDCSG